MRGPCSCGVPLHTTDPQGQPVRPYGKQWHTLHRGWHLDAFPNADAITVDNLGRAIENAP